MLDGVVVFFCENFPFCSINSYHIDSYKGYYRKWVKFKGDAIEETYQKQLFFYKIETLILGWFKLMSQRKKKLKNQNSKHKESKYVLLMGLSSISCSSAVWKFVPFDFSNLLIVSGVETLTVASDSKWNYCFHCSVEHMLKLTKLSLL